MINQSIQQFIQNSGLSPDSTDAFSLINNKLLLVQLDKMVWAKAGSMVAYEGQLKFEREKLLEHGLGKMFKKALTGEGVALMKASGKGDLLLADQGKQIHILDLNGDSLSVNGNSILAFEPSIQWDIKMMKRIMGFASGGLFNVHLSGAGFIAITSHGTPVTLQVSPDKPVFTDPNATIAWSSNLQPEMHTDLQLRSFFGRGSGESFQMKFTGDTGYIIVQPFEEIYWTQSTTV